MFDNMFLEFLGIPSGLAPIEERRVGLDEFDDWVVSTVAITDIANYSYETAVCHPDFNDGNYIAVDHYKTVEEAKEGHQKWVDHCKSGPETLEDPMRANICKDIGLKPTVFTKRKNDDE